MKSDKYFVRIDEEVFQDSAIRALLKKGGFEYFGLYVGLLTTVRRYKEHGYRIPLSDVPDIATWDFHVKEDALRRFLDDSVAVGLLIVEDGFIWSERRKRDLEEQDAKRLAYRNGAAKTNAKKAAKQAAARQDENAHDPPPDKPTGPPRPPLRETEEDAPAPFDELPSFPLPGERTPQEEASINRLRTCCRQGPPSFLLQDKEPPSAQPLDSIRNA